MARTALPSYSPRDHAEPVLSLVEGLPRAGRERLARDTARAATWDRSTIWSRGHRASRGRFDLTLETHVLQRSVTGIRRNDEWRSSRRAGGSVQFVEQSHLRFASRRIGIAQDKGLWMVDLYQTGEPGAGRCAALGLIRCWNRVPINVRTRSSHSPSTNLSLARELASTLPIPSACSCRKASVLAYRGPAT